MKTVERRKRAPLTLPEEDYPTRKRPPVDLDKARFSEAQRRKRPAVNPDDIRREGERSVHEGRITGEKHSNVSTAAPVRVRTPEQNRSTSDGIPVRRSNVGSGSASDEVETADGAAGRQTFFAVALAMLFVVLMMTVVVFSVNRAYRREEKDRSADFSMNMGVSAEDAEELPKISDFGTGDGQSVDQNGVGRPSDTDADSDTDSVKDTDAESAVDSERESAAGSEKESAADSKKETAAGSERETAADSEKEAAAEPVRYTVTFRFYNRDPITVTTESVTVGELLALVGYELQDTDRMYVDAGSLITEDAVIDVDTVEYRTVEETVSIPYTSTVNEVQTIPRGEIQYRQYGVNGSKTLTYTAEYVNGREISRTLSGERIDAEPVAEIYDIGVGGVLTGADGNTYSYSYYRVVIATYYDIEGLTWKGTYASENTIATNFDYIPLGTRVYVKNDKFDFGVREVEDTGSLVHDYEIDIWISDDNPQKAAFAQIGYHTDMVIYYLD